MDGRTDACQNITFPRTTYAGGKYWFQYDKVTCSLTCYGYFQAIHEWYLGSDGSHRKTLALCGYTGLHLARKEEIRACDVVQSMETSSQQAQFDMQLQQYQVQFTPICSFIISFSVNSSLSGALVLFCIPV